MHLSRCALCISVRLRQSMTSEQTRWIILTNYNVSIPPRVSARCSFSPGDPRTLRSPRRHNPRVTLKTSHSSRFASADQRGTPPYSVYHSRMSTFHLSLLWVINQTLQTKRTETMVFCVSTHTRAFLHTHGPVLWGNVIVFPAYYTAFGGKNSHGFFLKGEARNAS